MSPTSYRTAPPRVVKLSIHDPPNRVNLFPIRLSLARLEDSLPNPRHWADEGAIGHGEGERRDIEHRAGGRVHICQPPSRVEFTLWQTASSVLQQKPGQFGLLPYQPRGAPRPADSCDL